MAEWFCFKCKEKMVETDIKGTYMEILRFIPGLKCPKCGVAFVTEKIAVEVIVPGEDEIEAKLG